MNSTVMIIGAAVPIVGIIVLLWLRRRGGPGNGVSDAAPRAGRKTIGVRFVADSTAACNGAQRSDGHVFALDGAPRLPLPGCKRRKCKCQLRDVDNRRRLDRRGPRSAASNEPAPTEVRSKRGRRREDRLWHDVS